MAKADMNFRQAFARMAPQAIINREELASLLATTAGAVAQMAYRGELPPTAFPGKRRACWFVADIRAWLDDVASKAHLPTTQSNEAEAKRRVGRPRLPLSGEIY
ncbi:helix-turn-helix transcriptional regulator [Burkholderia gladioli]|uniref:helix-turn-helix transcriptional regulator n=1 Tax=Burkholderia gladioli TaxID=28095 RepID=UPI003D359E6B